MIKRNFFLFKDSNAEMHVSEQPQVNMRLGQSTTGGEGGSAVELGQATEGGYASMKVAPKSSVQ